MPKTILVVDDSRSVLAVIGTTLKVAGYNVIQASDGQEGLDALTGDEHVDMIITDLNMPNMDGMTFIQEIKKLTDYASTPVCMLTTETEQSKLENNASISTDAWITKPVQPARVIDIVGGILPP
jgi:two-component system, chemotaxis family, chemotaxis protein CheY